MTLRTLAGFASVVVISLLGAACSHAPSNSRADISTTDSVHAQAVKFAECMREKGVSAFPDPEASGELTLDGVVNGSSIDTESATWDNAIADCKSLQPPGFTGTKRNAQQQSASLKFAQCIRDNGVKDFPDPVEGEPLVNTNLIPSTDTKGGLAILNAAMKKCSEAAAEAGVGKP